MSTRGRSKLELDGRWALEELSDITKDYVQLYGFMYSLLPDLTASQEEDVAYIYGKFPWRGGYSTVNFFNQLFHRIPPKYRPEIVRIKYASPGYIELAEILHVAAMVSAIVFVCSRSLRGVHDLYRSIQKGAAEHELSKIDIANKRLDLTKKQLEFCENASRDLARAFGLSRAQEMLLDHRVDGNSAMKMKILLSVFRRVFPLAEKQSEGKLNVLTKDRE